MSKFLITRSIIHDAEEDLRRLLIGEDLDPEKFNYSPYILRCINEKLLENGSSLGLGYKSNRSLVDRYWKKLTLPLKSDVVVRIIDGQKFSQDFQIVILIKDSNRKEIIWNELYQIKSIKPRNDRVFRGTVPVFNELDVDDVVDEIFSIIKEKSLSFSLERFRLLKKEIVLEGTKFNIILPEALDYSCIKCNMCELPSNYSINPIPNKCNQPYSELLSSERIGFSSNLVCLELSEIDRISNEIEMRTEDFSLPILVVRDMSEKITDIQFGLKQNQGICIFQDIRNCLCTIHHVKPINCKSYPFIINEKGEKDYDIELDFSCPGISINRSQDYVFPIENLLNEVVLDSEFNWEQLGLILSKWDLLGYFSDGDRVRIDDVKTAFEYLKSDYESSENYQSHST